MARAEPSVPLALHLCSLRSPISRHTQAKPPRSLNSPITPHRDLGSGYSKLEVLFVARCRIVDLQGIGSMRSLKELYAAYNDIEELGALAMLDTLEILDVEWWVACP